MSTSLTELKQKRAGIVAQARKVLDLADTEKRSLTSAETEQYDRAMTEVDQIGEQIKAADTAAERRSRVADLERELATSNGRRVDPGTPGGGSERRSDVFTMEVRSQPGGDRPYMPIEFKSDTPQFRLSTPERRSAFNRWLSAGKENLNDAEFRDLQADSDTAGGFLNSPMQMVQQLLKFVDNAVIVRQKATIWQVGTSNSLGVPTLDSDINDSDWTAEVATGQNDTGIAFGKRELHPKPLAKRVKVSNKLLRTAAIGPESIVRDRMGYKMAVTQEKAYMLGNGATQPLGVFVASTNGISTARDVTSVNTTTAIVADALIDTKYSLKPQYQAKAEWMFHRDALKNIRKLKDGNGQYIWAPGLAGREPDTLLDRPVNQSEYVPNTFTTGQYVGILGDWSFYWIADALTLQIQRLVELYAEANQTGFIGRIESDGMPVLEEAFSRVKLA